MEKREAALWWHETGPCSSCPEKDCVPLALHLYLPALSCSPVTTMWRPTDKSSPLQSNTHTVTHVLQLKNCPIWLVINVGVCSTSQWLSHRSSCVRLEAATWSYVCMCVRVCSVSEWERDIVLDSDKMEDYYLVYCIYILSIFSKLYFFSSCCYCFDRCFSCFNHFHRSCETLDYF